MVRLLLTVFGVGLVVAFLCAVGVQMLGGYHGPWPSSGRKWATDADLPFFPDDAPKGPDITRDLAWNGGDSLNFDVPAVVQYTQAPQTRITVTGPEAWVNKLVMEGDTLAMTGGVRLRRENNHSLRVTISAPDVRRFELNSAQKLDIADYLQDELEIQSNGAAQINAYGSTKTLRLEMNGAGQANLGQLVNSDAEIEINGAGQATLAATNSVKVEINGFGQARLLHQPKSLRQEIHGFGKVEIGPDAENDDGEAAKPARPAPTPSAKPAPKLKAA